MIALMFIILFVGMFIGIPISAAAGLSTLGWVIAEGKPMSLFANCMYMGLDSFVRLAIPLFILCGYLMQSCGLSERLVDGVSVWVGNIRGSMGMITIIACTIFAALTGSAPATVAAIGAIMLPALYKQGYNESQAGGVICAAACLGPIIPPSIGMIVYGALMSVSIPKMFAGAIVPGLMLSFGMIILNQIQVRRWGMKAEKRKPEPGERRKKTLAAIPAMLMPVFILGSIYGGVCTPSEAACIACVYALILGVCMRTLNVKNVWSALKRTCATTAAVGFIMANVQLFCWILDYTRIPAKLSAFVMGYTTNPNVFMAIVCLIILVEGCFMESLSIIAIMAPILSPIGVAMGIDPVHMGVAFCLCMVMGVITPPFGVNLFFGVATTGISYDKIVKGVLPYLIINIAIVVFCCFCPPTTQWLVHLIYG